MISIFMRRPDLAAKAAGAASIVAQNMFAHFLEKSSKASKKPSNENKSHNESKSQNIDNQLNPEQNKSSYSKPSL